MHPRSRRYTVLATAGLALALAACSSSTSPKPVTPQTLATHYDSIYSSLLAAGTEEDSEIATIIAISTVLPPAYGAPQTSFTVTTAAGTATWKGYTIELVQTGDNDSSFVTVAFSDNNLSQLVFAESDYNACGPDGGSAIALVNLSAGGDDSTFTGSGSLTSVGNACPALQSGLASASLIGEVTTGADCSRAMFNVSFSATFYADEDLGPLSSVSISNVTFDGIRVDETALPSHVPPGPTRVAALVRHLRDLRVAHSAR